MNHTPWLAATFLSALLIPATAHAVQYPNPVMGYDNDCVAFEWGEPNPLQYNPEPDVWITLEALDGPLDVWKIPVPGTAGIRRRTSNRKLS